MKTGTLLLLFTVLFSACKKEDKWEGLDPNAMLAINAPKGSKAAENPAHLTPLEIVQKASALNINTASAPWALEDWNRDYERVRIVLQGFNVVNEKGQLVDVFIANRDVTLEAWTNWGTPLWDVHNYTQDTIAYIPNAVLETAQAAIEEAYEAGDYATCYKLFEEAYTFYPITGAEWRALKAAGIE